MSGGRDQSPVEVDKMDEVLEELKDKSEKDILIEIAMLLRKIEYHLSIASDTDLKDYEV